MKLKLCKFFIFTLFTSNLLTSQIIPSLSSEEKYTQHNKGKLYVYWGGNRSFFTNSSLRIKGEGYNFVLHDLDSHDRPQGWTTDYINPSRLTIPQNNLRIGYFISDKYNVSFGLDHMKYVMSQNQRARISGTYPSSYDGVQVIDGIIDLSDGKFIRYENTDGLNYINLEVARVHDLSKYFGIKNTDKFQVNLTEGVGFGLLFPKTDATLLSKARHDDYNLSGYGTHIKAGLNLTFFKHYFIQGELRGGYINMNDIKVSFDKADVGSQDFFFLQRLVVFGTVWKLF
ncbi:MAG: hypothetical protein ACEQSF_03930 [Solirubrobacteraceae bacterium]